MSNVWLKNAKKNLLPLSEEQNNFIIATKEWNYRGLEDNSDSEMDCELCEHEHIRYEYTIINKYNKNKMIVGSSCIEKFIEHVEDNNSVLLDTEGNIVKKERMGKEKQEFWKKRTIEIIEEKFFSSPNSDFKENLIEAIRIDVVLTCNQAKCLKSVYNKLKDNSIDKTAMRNSIKVRLRRITHKNQYYDLNHRDKEFVRIFLSPDQIQRMEE